MNQKLLIIDGHNLLFQAFYGMPNKFTNSQGKYIHGVVGFIGALRKIINLVEPSNILVIFDKEQHNNRCDINPDYKANRQDYRQISDDENPFSQLEYIYNCLTFMQITHFEVDNVEADDLIADYAFKYGKQIEIVICSYDSDFFQLINDNVKILRYRGVNSIHVDDNYLLKKYNVTAKKYSFFKSLTGDSSDNIKGVTGIGLKKAAKITNQFSCIEQLYQDIDNFLDKKLVNVLLNEKEKLLNNYQIINLSSKNMPLLSLDELVCHVSDFKTNDILDQLKIR